MVLFDGIHFEDVIIGVFIGSEDVISGGIIGSLAMAVGRKVSVKYC